MQKIKDLKEFVEKIDASKKVNPKDLSNIIKLKFSEISR